ncbi:PTS lactose/cellobiose transporter subunit IIA [Ferdinandcohnia quinoae]|uniref:PTS lactose/cellobiose transporter subunit IIA n=1 Tax=Fredinandcohnia quinoae TaxID=2918902 RepID=A0AAW5E9C6_9BACI|nr:PTS lactose/cellobiose transporter subunit IIA [Fredinandcohnia sp. SECRCQ15]MCH1626497.1 PTS lactose/cellobiose transporter subunit IIA [Fredinandcohnia sp. SECRCQ15]
MNIEETIMKIILHSGNAKSDAFEAIQAAKDHNIELARECMEKANQELTNAHHVQTSLIQAEARGEKTEVSLLLIHAQDHLMNAITFKDLANEFVDLYETLKG